MPARNTYRLLPHSPLPNLSDLAIEVDVSPSAAGLSLSYRITGAINAIRLPPVAAAGPVDDLWRHTCCEAFVVADDVYHEFNFSPAGSWAIYRFTDIRQRDPAYRPPVALAIHCATDADGVMLTVVIPSVLLPAGTERRLGLTAVIEHADGALTYWALRHDALRPDFHRPASFLAPLDYA